MQVKAVFREEENRKSEKDNGVATTPDSWKTRKDTHSTQGTPWQGTPTARRGHCGRGHP